MKPLIEKIPEIGASVKTIRNQFISYNCSTYRNYIYPYTKTTLNGEYFAINAPTSIRHKLFKEGISISINSTKDINILKYLINKLY